MTTWGKCGCHNMTTMGSRGAIFIVERTVTIRRPEPVIRPQPVVVAVEVVRPAPPPPPTPSVDWRLSYSRTSETTPLNDDDSYYVPPPKTPWCQTYGWPTFWLLFGTLMLLTDIGFGVFCVSRGVNPYWGIGITLLSVGAAFSMIFFCYGIRRCKQAA